MTGFRGMGGSAKASGRAQALSCEVCGSPTKTAFSIEVDGAILRVCQNCSRLGRPVHVGPPGRRPAPPVRASAARGIEVELDIDPGYALTVRRAREKLGLTQEALGRMINVKPSVIHHVETGKMKPDMILARTLMHSLKVNLLVPSSELDSTG